MEKKEKEKQKPLWKHIPWIDLCIFFFWFLAYALTTSHSVVEGDTGEFLASAAVGGVPHDPGFPLYSLFTRLVFLLPFGHSAYAVNLVSAEFASVALVFVFRLVKLITNNTVAALFSVLSLGTYENFWFYASVAQVHSLQILLLSLFSYTLVLFVKTKRVRYLYWCSLLFGLGLAHSYTILFVVPSLLLVLFSFRKELLVQVGVKAFSIFLLGLLPYVYIIFASVANPPINWGRIHDLNSFLFVLIRGDYGFFNLGPQKASAPFLYSSFVYYVKSLFLTSWYVVIFACVSLWYLYKKDVVYALLFCTFVLIGPFFYLLMDQHILSVTYQANVAQYFSYSFLFLSIFAGLGVVLLFEKYKVIRKHTVVVSVGIVLLFLIPFVTTYQHMQKETDGLITTTVERMLSEIPQNGVLITSGDDIYFPALYLQYVENYRSDITLINLNLSAPWYLTNLRMQHPSLAFLFSNPHDFYSNACRVLAPKQAVYVYPWTASYDTAFGTSCEVIPDGLLNKVVQVKRVPSIQNVKVVNDTLWKRYMHEVPLGTYQNSSARTREFLLSLADQLTFSGIYYERKGERSWALTSYQLATAISPDENSSLISESTLAYKENNMEESLSLLKEGVQRNPAVPILYKNLGVLYAKENNGEAAYHNFQQYLTFNPSDNDIVAIENFINAYTATAH